MNSPQDLEGMHPAGKLTITAEAAFALGVDSIPASVITDKPNNQPFVDVVVVDNPPLAPANTPNTISYHGLGYIVRVGKGPRVNQPAEVVLSIEDIDERGLRSTPTDKLGRALSERLHGKRVAKIAALSAVAVFVSLMWKSGELDGLRAIGNSIWAAGAYLGIRGLGRVINPKYTLSVDGSYQYANKVTTGVVNTILGD